MDALRTELSTFLYTASPPAGSYTFRFSSAACALCAQTPKDSVPSRVPTYASQY